MTPAHYDRLYQSFRRICELPKDRQESHLQRLGRHSPELELELRELLLADQNPFDIEGALRTLRSQFARRQQENATWHAAVTAP